MPLPRPIGDPFGNPGDDGSQASSTKRPISASAFSFHLGPKKVKQEVRYGGVEPKEEAKEGSAPGTSILSIPNIKMETPLRARATPLRLREMTSMKPLDSLPSYTLTPNRTPNGRNDSPSVSRKVTDSPFVSGIKRKHDEKDKMMNPLGSIRKVDYDFSKVEAVKRVEEEGVGVSPMGKKIVKYGKGPAPLSFVLSSALNSQHSSLVLFYASLQNTLYPNHKKSATAPTIAQQLKSAPVILKPKEVVRGRTGWSTMCYCKVNGSLHGAEKDGKSSESSGTDTVLVVFQPVPSECAKLGLDPRIILLKPPSSSQSYEIGLWGPWLTTILPDDCSGSIEGSSEPEGTDIGEGGEEGKERVIRKTVVFASRYLIAEL